MRKGSKQTEEAKQKLREANLGKHLSEEARRKVSAFQKGRPRQTKRPRKVKVYVSKEESRKKMSLAHLGKTHTEGTKELMSLKKIGVPKSEIHRQHNSEAQMGSVIVRFPDETRHKVYSRTFEDFLEEADRKKWSLTDREARLVWFMTEDKRERNERWKEKKNKLLYHK